MSLARFMGERAFWGRGQQGRRSTGESLWGAGGRARKSCDWSIDSDTGRQAVAEVQEAPGLDTARLCGRCKAWASASSMARKHLGGVEQTDDMSQLMV